MALIQVVHAHPYPRRSRACAALEAAIRDLPHLEVRRLYDRYPDFDIDVPAEQAALEKAKLLVWLHPIHWYTAPGLLKHWMDIVLTRGFAYGEGGHKLRGKHCLWVPTAGGDEVAYSAEGRHTLPLSTFEPVMAQTARYCGMEWLDPMPVLGAHHIDDATLAAHGQHLRERLARWTAQHARHA